MYDFAVSSRILYSERDENSWYFCNMWKKILHWFDRFEDSVRGRLSRHPVLYAFIGGTGVIVFWRGVWHTTDYAMRLVSGFVTSSSSDLSGMVWWDGPLSIFLGGGLLLVTGVLVPSFIGNELIISGIRKEKKMVEKTEEELTKESITLLDIHDRLLYVEKLFKKEKKDFNR